MSDSPGSSNDELARLVEGKVVPLLERIAIALERGHAISAAARTIEAASVPALSVEELRDRINAARKVNDPEGAMSLRDDLAKVIQGDELKDVDQGLVKWLMSLIQKRLRVGTVRADVVELATKVADRFGATVEGASLKAALPTLRRSAGLCPRCAEPYIGVADACPKCLAPSGAPVDDAAESLMEAEADAALEPQGGPVDLNNDDLWKVP